MIKTQLWYLNGWTWFPSSGQFLLDTGDVKVGCFKGWTGCQWSYSTTLVSCTSDRRRLQALFEALFNGGQRGAVGPRWILSYREMIHLFPSGQQERWWNGQCICPLQQNSHSSNSHSEEGYQSAAVDLFVLIHDFQLRFSVWDSSFLLLCCLLTSTAGSYKTWTPLPQECRTIQKKVPTEWNLTRNNVVPTA